MGEDVWDLSMKIQQLFMAVMSKPMAAWLSTSVPKDYPQVLYLLAHSSSLGFLPPMISLGAGFFRPSSEVSGWGLSCGHCLALSSSVAPPDALPAVHSYSP